MTRRPARLATFSYKGCERYFLTMCCKDRRHRFHEPFVVETCRLQFLETAERLRFAVLAYVFMPDHMHALVEGRDQTADLRRFLATFRRRTSAATWRSTPGGLWQDGYFERVLRENDRSEEIIDYILSNPVRSGLVTLAVDYPYSWSCTLDETPRSSRRSRARRATARRADDA